MKMKIACATLLWLAFSHFAAAQSPPAPTPPPSPAARVDQVAWLAGYWEGDGMGGKIEDFWMPPRDGVLLGGFRLTKPDGKGFYELFAIEEFEGSLRFVVKHFHPNWVGWEEKDQALKLRLTRIGTSEAVFGGVAFRKEGADELVVTLTMRSRDGSSREDVLRFRKRAL
jgi:hypothetical protein